MGPVNLPRATEERCSKLYEGSRRASDTKSGDWVHLVYGRSVRCEYAQAEADNLLQLPGTPELPELGLL